MSFLVLPSDRLSCLLLLHHNCILIPEFTYLSDNGGAGSVVHPAMLAGAQWQLVPVRSQAGQWVHTVKGALVPVHLIPHALAEEGGLVRRPQARHGVVQLLCLAPATPLAQLSHPRILAIMSRGEAQEDDAHIDGS